MLKNVFYSVKTKRQNHLILRNNNYKKYKIIEKQ
jgi:hypothetical protein